MFTRFMFIFETMAVSISPLSSMSAAPQTVIFVPLEKQDAFTHSIPTAIAFRVRRMSRKVNQRKRYEVESGYGMESIKTGTFSPLVTNAGTKM